MRRVNRLLSGTFTVLLLTSGLQAQFSFDQVEKSSPFGVEDRFEISSTPRYNRVEGLFLNLEAIYRPRVISDLHITGSAGWGFANDADKQFRGSFGVRKDFFTFERLSVGARVFRDLASEDDWQVGDVENSLAAFFFRDDYKDYYGRHGFKVFVEHVYQGLHTLRLEIGRHTYDALGRNTNWSVFGGDEDFPQNPTRPEVAIVEGDEIAVRLIAAFDWRDNPLFPMNGWSLEGIYEHTEEDFATDGLFITLRRYMQTFGNQRLVVRGRVGTRHGSAAAQHSMSLGGPGSLRGFANKEFIGNRLVLLNADYLFGGDVFRKLPLRKIPKLGGLLSSLSLGAFVDTGWAWSTDPGDGLFSGFDALQFNDLQTDVGLSMLLLDGVFRLNVAKRLDRAEDDFQITIRLLERL